MFFLVSLQLTRLNENAFHVPHKQESKARQEMLRSLAVNLSFLILQTIWRQLHILWPMGTSLPTDEHVANSFRGLPSLLLEKDANQASSSDIWTVRIWAQKANHITRGACVWEFTVWLEGCLFYSSRIAALKDSNQRFFLGTFSWDLCFWSIMPTWPGKLMNVFRKESLFPPTISSVLQLQSSQSKETPWGRQLVEHSDQPPLTSTFWHDGTSD